MTIRVGKSLGGGGQTKIKGRAQEEEGTSQAKGRRRESQTRSVQGTPPDPGSHLTLGIVSSLCWCPEPITTSFWAPLPARPTELGGKLTPLGQKAQHVHPDSSKDVRGEYR